MPEATLVAAIVLVDIHPGESVHEMEGGEEEAEVTVLGPRRAGKRRRRGICLASMHRGDF
jgi:hypothetical protein